MPYLIRHTTPAVEKGICYGQADLDITPDFEKEVEHIRSQISETPSIIYSSPLIRCSKLAIRLAASFGIKEIQYEEALKEMNFGEWEMKKWSDIPEPVLTPWMEDFVNIPVPSGESFAILHQRVQDWWNSKKPFPETTLIVSHAGPIRSILSSFNNTVLEQAFKLYPMNYGWLGKI